MDTFTQDVSRAHARAVYDILDQALTYVDVHFGTMDMPDPLEYPYIIVWPPPAARTTVNLSATLASAVSTVQITAVGDAPDDVLATLDRAAEALQGQHPDIPGRNTGVIMPVPGLAAPVQQLDITRTNQGRPLFQGVAQFRLHSVPASQLNQ